MNDQVTWEIIWSLLCVKFLLCLNKTKLYWNISAEEDALLIPSNMTNDCIAQSWFRFLHCLGNPASLCRPAVISQTQKFLQFAITSENVVDPCQHPCLSTLPLIFLKSMKGVAWLVDAFLGKSRLMYIC